MTFMKKIMDFMRLEDVRNPEYNNEIRFFNKMLSLIMRKNFNAAYFYICKRNAQKPIPPGIGCDWNKWAEEGLDTNRKLIYYSLFNNTKSSSLIIAAAIYSNMSGETERNIFKFLKSCYDCKIDEIKELNFYCSFISNEIEMKSYIESDIESYIFIATLDTRTCPICGSLDNKRFKVSERVRGINYPPMHKGCRCTTISDIKAEDLARKKRWARDPATGKTMYVPANMTYEEWHKKYIK